MHLQFAIHFEPSLIFSFLGLLGIIFLESPGILSGLLQNLL